MKLTGLFTKNKTIHLPKELKAFNKVFADAGFKAYLVGGAVRDIFLNKEASDWDVTTNATPQDVIKLFKFVVPTGIAHGTVTVHFMKKEIEVTTFRTESDYTDGRHPDKVTYAATIEEDLSRRDFTMNAIAINLADGKIVDPFGGRHDIKKKCIKTVGNAHSDFRPRNWSPKAGSDFFGCCSGSRSLSSSFRYGSSCFQTGSLFSGRSSRILPHVCAEK